MDLSNDLISKFVKITNDDKNKNSESTVYGTVVEYNGGMYVRIDGSDLLTPVETTADFKPNERVTVMIKNHSATVTGNITSPSTNEGAVIEKVTEAVEDVEGKVITEVEILIADRVSTGQLDAEVARIDELIAGKASVEDLTATNAEITNLKADKASVEDLKATNAEITNLKADKATVEDLTATNAEITNLKAKDAEIENLVADKARIEDLTATNARIDSLQANKADITYLDANFATIDELEAAHADIEILDAEVANINTLVNGNLTSDNILSLNITSQNTTMENAFVKDAMIDTVTANKIMSGTIDTNNVTIQSTDGSMLLQGTLLQMKDDNGKVRIQIGKDTGGNFTFILYDESGTGVLIDEEGIKSSDAIADGLIVDAKVADNANIAGSKLNIASVITEVNKDNSTTIKSNKIYLDEQGQSLEVAFNSLKTQVETIQDVTIDGDLTAVIEQVQSNTTQIAANKEGISTLVSENTIRKEEIQNLDGEIESVNNTLSSKYSSLEQDVSGFKTTVADTYATKQSVTDVSNNLATNYSTTSAMNSAIQQKANEITSSVSETYATKQSVTDVSNNLATNYSTTSAMNSAIQQKANEITSSVSQTYATKQSVTDVSNNLSNNYSTTSAMNSAIQQKANEITSSVSETYATKSEFNNLQIGGTNLIQNGNFKGAIAGSTSMPNPWIFWGGEIHVYRSHGAPGYNHVGCVYIGCNLTDGSRAGITSNVIHVSKVEKGANYMASFVFARETNVKSANAYIEYLNDARDQILHSQALASARTTDNVLNELNEHQYHIPFTMWTGDFSYVKITFNHGGTNVVSAGYLMIVGNVQIEKGNKATDWSPAPEDIQGQIDATNANLQNNYSTTSQMNSAIQQKANEITSSVSQTYATKQLVTDVSNNLTNNYSTTSAMNSAIQQKANEITSSVSETYTTKSEFNALNIGSTNLVTGTKDFSISSGWYYHTYYMTKTNEAGIDSRFTGMSVSFSPSTAGDDYADLTKNNSVCVEPDTEYTLSFWAKGSGQFYTYLYGLSGGTVASHYNSSGYSGKQYDGSSIHTLSSNDTFKRYWVVYKTKSTVQGNANLIAARVAKNLNTDVNMVIYGVKFEKGNKPTDWSPAPEDVDASISSVDSKIETTNNKVATIETNLNGITQRVSSTESTTSTLTTKVNTAQSTADSAVNSFNNLAIGGTNLYPNSNFITRPTYSEISKSDIVVEWASSVDSGGTVAKYGGNLLRVYMNAAGDNYFTLSPQVTLEANTTYTLSYDYVSAGAISSNSSYIYLWGTFGDVSTRTVISAGDGQHTAKVRKRYKLTFTTGDRLIMQMRFGFANTSAAWLAVEGIKLEKGNKATEWSPSVNDVESRIDTAQSTADTANTQATTNKNNISSLTTTVSNTNNKVSSLETNLTNITSRVSATETNLTIATTKLDNLKIGGTNLLRDTKTLANWSYVGYSLQTGHYDGTMSAVYINYKTSSGIDYRDFTRGSAVWVEPSTEYTLSFWAKGTGKFYSYLYGASGGTIASGYNSSGNTSTANDGAIVTSLTSATQWRRYWVTWKTKSSVKQKVAIIPCRVYQGLGDCEVLICGVKLEVGNKATEWSPSPEDIETTVSNLTTRVSTAESKLDKDSLTTIIGSYYTTSSDVDGIVTSKKYATTSEVQQTKNELTATFTESGGYNLIKNSTGYGGTSCWIPSAGQVSYASHAPITRTGNSRFMYLSNTSLTTEEIYVYSSRFPLKGGKKYTLSGWFYMNPNVKSYDVFVLTSNSLDADNTSTEYDYVHHGGVKNNTGWQFLSFTFTTHSDVKSGEIRIDNNGYNKNGTTINCNVHWSSLMLNEGSIALPWSPHPSEVYDGITTIDKTGIKVSQSNYGGYTQMSANGFYVNDGSKNVVSVDSNGLYVQGNITSGSTIQGARITGSTFNSSNDVFQVLEDGTIETSFLAVNGAVSTDKLNVNDIENASYPKVLSEATTVYISPNGGVNAEEFYDGAYFTSLSNMLAVAPRNLNGYTLTIRMAGDLYENAALTWFHSGQVNFEMQGYTLYGYFYGYGASMCYRLYGNTNANNNGTWGHIKPNVGRSLGSYYYAVQFQYCQFAVNYIAVYPSSSSGSSSGGISAHRGATGIIFNAKACGDMRYLVRAEYAGRVHVNSTQGACNNATFCATTGAIITLNSSNNQAGRSTSGNPYWVGSGGIIAADQLLGMEKIKFNNTAQSGSSSSSGSATRKVTETVKATSADTYRSTVYNNWKGDGTVRQGDYGYGDCQGCWFFGNNLYNTMNAGTVTKVVIRIKRQSGGVNALQTLTVKSHNHTSRPSGAPTYTNTIGTCSCAVGSYIDLVITDQTTINKLKNCKGLGLSIGSASSPYAVCSGACSVIITYTTNN